MKKYIALVIMFLALLAGSVPAESFAAPKKKAASTTVKKAKKTKKKGSGKADYAPMNFLPFGVGQFTQGKYISGAVLGGGQAMMLFLYMDRKSQITASNNDANATIAEINAEGGTPPAETLDYLQRNSEYVKKTNQEANLALLGFFGLYAAGVVDAVWDPLGMRKTVAKKTAEIEEMDDDASKWVAEKKLDSLKTQTRIAPFALPTLDKAHSTFGLTFNKSFR